MTHIHILRELDEELPTMIVLYDYVDNYSYSTNGSNFHRFYMHLPSINFKQQQREQIIAYRKIVQLLENATTPVGILNYSSCPTLAYQVYYAYLLKCYDGASYTAMADLKYYIKHVPYFDPYFTVKIEPYLLNPFLLDDMYEIDL